MHSHGGERECDAEALVKDSDTASLTSMLPMTFSTIMTLQPGPTCNARPGSIATSSLPFCSLILVATTWSLAFVAWPDMCRCLIYATNKRCLEAATLVGLSGLWKMSVLHVGIGSSSSQTSSASYYIVHANHSILPRHITYVVRKSKCWAAPLAIVVFDTSNTSRPSEELRGMNSPRCRRPCLRSYIFNGAGCAFQSHCQPRQRHRCPSFCPSVQLRLQRLQEIPFHSSYLVRIAHTCLF